MSENLSSFLGNAESIPKRVMPIFFLIDTSGSMEGKKNRCRQFCNRGTDSGSAASFRIAGRFRNQTERVEIFHRL